MSPGFRFKVDDVERAELPLEEILAVYALERLVQERGDSDDAALPVLAASEDGPLVSCPSASPFFWAIYIAYSQHRPLILTPDAFWLTIAHGVEQHIALHPERLRPQLVSHEGRQTLELQAGSLSLTAGTWAECVEGWGEQIAQRADPDFAALMACDFSTSGPTERIAGKIVMMSALRHYFYYAIRIICGIPEIELRGTPRDWERIRARVDALDQYGLERWTAQLKPICDQLVETAHGRPDLTFWRSIYIPLDNYGGDLVVGWCAALCPYVRGRAFASSADIPNPVLDMSLEERLAAHAAWLREEPHQGVADLFAHGITLEQFPSAGSAAPIRRVIDGYEWEATLIGGVLGVRQEGLWLEPVACWVVREQSSTDTAASWLACRFDLRSSGAMPGGHMIGFCPAELLQIFDHLGAGALFGGRWTLLDPTCWLAARVGKYSGGAIFCRLSDGRYLLALEQQDTTLYIVADGELEPNEDDEAPRASGCVVVATSFEQLLMRLRSADGAFFMDAPRFKPPGALEEP